MGGIVGGSVIGERVTMIWVVSVFLDAVLSF